MAVDLRSTPSRRLWLGHGLSSVGDWMGLLATVAMARNLASDSFADSYAAQNVAIAGVFLLRLLPAFLLGPLLGAVGGRADRRWALVLGDVLSFGLFASIPLMGTLGWLYGATFLVECVALFRRPGRDGAIANLVPRRWPGAADRISLVVVYGSALLAALGYAALTFGADLVNVLASSSVLDPVAAALYVNALTFAVSGLLVWWLGLPPEPRADPGSGSVVRTIVEGWRLVGRTDVVRSLVPGMLGAFGAAGCVIGLSQTFAADVGAGQPGVAVLSGSVVVGLALGLRSGPRFPGDFSRRRLFGLALGWSGLCLVLLALIPSIVAAAVLGVGVGAGGGIAWVTGSALLGPEVDDEVRGRIFAFLRSAAHVMLVFALAAGPALAAPIGTHRLRVNDDLTFASDGGAWVFLFAGVLALVTGWTSFRRMDDRPGTSLVADLASAWPGGREDVGTPVGPDRTYPGVFIAFEGGDGAGKSTQARLLIDWLRHEQAFDVILTREPGATRLGVGLRALLLGSGNELGARVEALLFAADRAHHVETVIRPALERGDVVVTDRYSDSSVAYQGAGRHLDAEEVASLSGWATSGLRPDLTVLLDLPIEILRVRRAADSARAHDDRIESLPEDFHERVRGRFLDLARSDPRRYLVLDASEPREQLQGVIRRRVRDLAPISPRRRAELAARLAAEEDQRRRRAAAEAEVLKLDANLRGRSMDEARARRQALRAAREEAERAVREGLEGRTDPGRRTP